MPATKKDLKRVNMHLILTGISILTTVIFLVSMTGILNLLDQAYGDEPIIPYLVPFPQKIFYHDPFSLTMRIIDGDGVPSLVNGELSYHRIAYFTGVMGYLLNIGILLNSVLGLSVRKKSNIRWSAYVWSIVGALIGLTVVFNLLSWYSISMGLMIISLFLAFQMKSQIQTSIDEHEMIRADEIQYDRDLKNESVKSEVSEDIEKTANGASDRDSKRITEEAITGHSTSQSQDESN